MIRRLFIRLKRDERGAYAVELALVVPVFVAMLVGFMDFSYWVYMKSEATGALERVARSAGVGGATVDTVALQAPVEAQIKQIAGSATFVWTTKSYYNFSNVGLPEKLTTDNNGNGLYDPGDCWEDSTPNGVYDVSQGTNGVGGADDILYYTVVVTFPPLIPLSGVFPFLPDTRTVTASTMIKRQPYAAQPTPVIRC